MTDPVTLLKEIAKQFAKKVRRTEEFDANVCSSPFDKEKPWVILALPGDLFRHKVSFTFERHRVTLRANGEFLVTEILCDLITEVVSINRRDVVFALQPVGLQIPGFPNLRVFSRTATAMLRDWLCSKTLGLTLTALCLGQDKSLHIYRNGLVFYSKPQTTQEVLSAVKILCDFAETFPTQLPV